METKRKPKLCDNNTCTGCSACFSSCPVQAIAMRPHEVEGFYRPIIDYDRCIGCLKCEKSCPLLNSPIQYPVSQSIYAVWHKDENIRKNSSSGGAFSALALSILRQNGVVVGAAYTDDMHLRHILVNHISDLHKLQASKYFQSDLAETMKEVKQRLHEGTTVLFCGTPCQIAGLRAFLDDKEVENLYTVDFICHGVPSPIYFKQYLRWLNPHNTPIRNFIFRDKTKGWYDAVRVIVKGEPPKSTILKNKKDSYWVGFNNNLCLQEACYDCQFLGKQRRSDITVADFWRVGQRIPFGHKDEIEKGISMLMINSPKGESLFTQSKSNLEFYPRTLDEVLGGNQAMIHSSKRPISRNAIYHDLNQYGYEYVRCKYLNLGLKPRLVQFFREYMPRFIVKQLRTCFQK